MIEIACSLCQTIYNRVDDVINRCFNCYSHNNDVFFSTTYYSLPITNNGLPFRIRASSNFNYTLFYDDTLTCKNHYRLNSFTDFNEVGGISGLQKLMHKVMKLKTFA